MYVHKCRLLTRVIRHAEAAHQNRPALTETLPKNNTNTRMDTAVESSIKGYKLMEGNHDKREVLIYTANHLEVKKEVLSAAAHAEQLWCTIRSTHGNSILLGIINHSPRSTTENKQMRDTLSDTSRGKAKNIVVKGDFNMPGII